MAATGYILPATVDQTVIIGSDFSTTITLFTDLAQTSAFDLTGYTVSVAVGSLFTLTSGSGITVTPATGTIVVALTDTQTSTVVSPGSTGLAVHYALKLIDGSGLVTFPMSGTFTFKVA